jgi:hypothetical protein
MIPVSRVVFRKSKAQGTSISGVVQPWFDPAANHSAYCPKPDTRT